MNTLKHPLFTISCWYQHSTRTILHSSKPVLVYLGSEFGFRTFCFFGRSVQCTFERKRLIWRSSCYFRKLPTWLEAQFTRPWSLRKFFLVQRKRKRRKQFVGQREVWNENGHHRQFRTNVRGSLYQVTLCLQFKQILFFIPLIWRMSSPWIHLPGNQSCLFTWMALLLLFMLFLILDIWSSQSCNTELSWTWNHSEEFLSFGTFVSFINFSLNSMQNQIRKKFIW